MDIKVKIYLQKKAKQMPTFHHLKNLVDPSEGLVATTIIEKHPLIP
jgi:hypothetical protein